MNIINMKLARASCWLLAVSLASGWSGFPLGNRGGIALAEDLAGRRGGLAAAGFDPLADVASELGEPVAVDAVIEPKDRTASQSNALQVTLLAKSRLASSEVASAKMQLRHMMRLDDDLSAFYAICASDPQRAWIAARGAGRLLRSATVFYDLMKLLFTTNTTWTSTEHMTRNLVQAIGSKAPSGRRAFPTAKQCLRDEAFYADVVRCGYRKSAAVALAQGFVSR